jgi:hypothetical protein
MINLYHVRGHANFFAMNNPVTQPIEAIRSDFKDEWLLIAVDKLDSDTGVPTEGHLVAHGPHREDIHEASMNYDGDAYIIYSEDWPEDLAASFVIIA